MAYTKLLEGIVILDFTQALAASLCPRILADMGAEILKVERSPRGDMARDLGGGYSVKHSNVVFLFPNAGKKSLCVDFHNPEGIRLVKQLVPQVDAVLEAYSPGYMKKYGLDYASVQPLKSDIVYCSMSAYGQNGPYRDMVAFNPMVEAMSGFVYMTGEPDSHPQLPGFSIGDTGASIHNTVAVLAALLYRDRTGVGQYVDTAMLDGYKGYPGNYNRINVRVFDEDGTAVEAVTYIKAGRLEETQPSKEYLAVIQQGYKDWGIF